MEMNTKIISLCPLLCQCGLHNASDNALRFVKENFLADDSVRPVGRNLTMVSAENTYSHLTVQRVQAANGKHYTVLFLLTGRTADRAAKHRKAELSHDYQASQYRFISSQHFFLNSFLLLMISFLFQSLVTCIKQCCYSEGPISLRRFRSLSSLSLSRA